MAVSYISPGDEVTAEAMNAIWRELDTKLSIILSGKTPLIIQGPHPVKYASYHTTLGKKFFFLGTGEKYFTPGMPDAVNYDHSTFTDALASATVDEVYEPAKLARISVPTQIDFDDSLEAHKLAYGGSEYWVRMIGAPRATRRSAYGCAELIFEGQTQFTLPSNYDRYSFYRIHNLNRAVLTLRINDPGGETVFRIDPLSIKTIRKIDGVWTSPLTYLWEVEPGDPRTYSLIGDHGGNNVVSPAVGFLIANAFLALDRNQFGWRIDPENNYTPSGYDDLFGDWTQSVTKLADLIYHKGTFKVVERTGGGGINTSSVEYSGIDGLNASLSQFGIQRNGSTLERPAGGNWDVVALSTNLLKSGENTVAFAQLPYTLESEIPRGDYYASSPETTNPTAEETYFDLFGVEHSVSRKYDTQSAAVSYLQALPIVSSRISDVEAALGNDGYTSLTWDLSVNGFFVAASQDLATGVLGLQDVIDATVPTETQKLEFDGGTLRLASRISLGRHGWPENLGTGGNPPRRWHSPRVPARWVYLDLDLSIEWHDDAIDGYASPDVAVAPFGDDISILTTDSQQIASYAILGLVESASETVPDRNWPERYLCADRLRIYEFLQSYQSAGWYEQNRDRLINGPATVLSQGITKPNGLAIALLWPMAAETYNHLAWRVNSLYRGYPIQLWDAYGYLSPSDRGLYDGGIETTLRPKNQFRRVDVGDAAYNQAQTLGITIRNYNQLPTNWQNIRSQQHYSTNWYYRLRETVFSGSVAFDGVGWVGTVEKQSRYDGTIYGSGQSAYVDGYFDRDIYRPGDLNDEYYWLAVEDVKTVSDALGFSFAFGSYFVVDYKINTSATAPTPGWVGESYESYYSSSGRFGSESEAQAWVDGLVGAEATADYLFTANRQFVRLVPPATVDEVEWIETASEDVRDYRGESGDDPVSAKINASNTSYFRIYKPDEVKEVDGGEYAKRGYHVWGTLESAGAAFWIPKHYFTREVGFAYDSVAQAAHYVAYGEAGRPVTFVDAIQAATSEAIDSSAIFTAYDAPSNFELALLVDRYKDLT